VEREGKKGQLRERKLERRSLIKKNNEMKKT